MGELATAMPSSQRASLYTLSRGVAGGAVYVVDGAFGQGDWPKRLPAQRLLQATLPLELCSSHTVSYIVSRYVATCGCGVFSFFLFSFALRCVALLCGVWVRLHLILFPAGGSYFPSLSVHLDWGHYVVVTATWCGSYVLKPAL
jgi:hypothetical protein